MPFSKQSLVLCHNAVGSIQAKDSAQAGALAQCLGELEEEIKKVDRGANVVVMQKKQTESPTDIHRRKTKKGGKPVEVPKAPAEV